MKTFFLLILPFSELLLLPACSTAPGANLNLSSMPPFQLRTIQTRHFGESNKVKVLQAVIKTLSSLDFLILRTDDQIGLVEALQVEQNHIMQVNVLVRNDLSKTGSDIRLSGRFDQNPIESSEACQQFFEALSHYIS